MAVRNLAVTSSASGHSGINWRSLPVGDQDNASGGKQDSSGGLETNTAHSLNIKERPHPTKVQSDGQVYRVNGTPADCVYLAVVLSEPLPRRPDLIVSGINLGPNLGDDVYRSGTVAGAREGAFRDIPSIAFSLAVGRAGRLDFLRQKPDFSHAAEYAQELALHVLHSDIGERTYLNVSCSVVTGERGGCPRVDRSPRPSSRSWSLDSRRGG